MLVFVKHQHYNVLYLHHLIFSTIGLRSHVCLPKANLIMWKNFSRLLSEGNVQKF